MPKLLNSIIPKTDCGGILHLPDAIDRYPDARIVLYDRASAHDNAGKGNVKLKERTHALADAIDERFGEGRVVRDFILAVEKGKLSRPRKGLLLACESARKFGAIVVASDLSRFLRSESYCRRKNPNAWPTADEFRRLRELSGGVTLATFERPDMQEDERHSKATRRTGKAGRPRTINDKKAARIFADLGFYYVDMWGKWHWQGSIAAVARRHRVSSQAILRMADRKSPSGKTWRDVGIDRAVEAMILKRGDDGSLTRFDPHDACIPSR